MQGEMLVITSISNPAIAVTLFLLGETLDRACSNCALTDSLVPTMKKL